MTLTSASWWTNAATAEETPLSMQKLWPGDRQSEMAGNSIEKNPTWSVRWWHNLRFPTEEWKICPTRSKAKQNY